jgi:CelD/BcsL family acetyltransferase involved in cellulose biosynthesis
MRVSVIPARSLDCDLGRAWSDIQGADPVLSSPFLAPEFTLAVAAERANVAVGILERDARPVGFFPHERGRFATGQPVGGSLNDLQGLVAGPDVEIAAEDLVRGCRLVHWTFTRIIASQTAFARHHIRRDVSRFIDLSDGFAAYARDKHVPFAERLLRKGRKIEREVGPLRFEVHNPDPSALARLMAWKAARYRSAGYMDVFTRRWTRRVMERIHATQTARFAGLLSLLWAGDDLAAGHFGIRCGARWHSWVVSYAPQFARYSPGLLLYWNLAEAAGGLGVKRIEIGGGDYPYKSMLANAAIAVAGGSVDRIPAVTAVRQWSEQSKDRLRASVLRPPARMLLRTYRRMIGPGLK